MIFIVTGGTGGHLFPAMHVYEELKNREHDTFMIIDERVKHHLQNKSIHYDVILIKPPTKKIQFLISLLSSCFQSFLLFRKYKPRKIISFGSYVSLPVLICAFICRIPIYMHESNSVLGKAQKLFSPVAKKITTGFPISENKKYVFTGNPTGVLQVNKVIYNREQHLKILICGGSQGAKFIDDNVSKAICKISKKYNITITHQCSKFSNMNDLKSLYISNNIPNNINNFFPNILEEIATSHVIISRAGAQTIAEISAIGTPAIYLPYPNSTNNHQYKNALYVASAEAAIILEQYRFSDKILSQHISNILSSEQCIMRMHQKARILFPSHSAKKIVDIILNDDN